jgi:hypothetical protein
VAAKRLVADFVKQRSILKALWRQGHIGKEQVRALPRRPLSLRSLLWKFPRGWRTLNLGGLCMRARACVRVRLLVCVFFFVWQFKQVNEETCRRMAALTGRFLPKEQTMGWVLFPSSVSHPTFPPPLLVFPSSPSSFYSPSRSVCCFIFIAPHILFRLLLSPLLAAFATNAPPSLSQPPSPPPLVPHECVLAFSL